MIHKETQDKMKTGVLGVLNHRLDSIRKNMFYYGVKLYIDLPVEMKQRTSLNSFKIMCKKHNIENYDHV